MNRPASSSPRLPVSVSQIRSKLSRSVNTKSTTTLLPPSPGVGAFANETRLMASAREHLRMSTSNADRPTQLYEEMEANAADAMERLVGSTGFGGLLGQFAENAAAMTKLGADAMDLVLRNLRVAGRRDVVRLGQQLARTEDKLERVLQEVEELRDELAKRSAKPAASRAKR